MTTESLIDKIAAASWYEDMDGHCKPFAIVPLDEAIAIIRENTITPNYHAAVITYINLGFDADGKIIEWNVYDLIKKVVDAAMEPLPKAESADTSDNHGSLKQTSGNEQLVGCRGLNQDAYNQGFEDGKKWADISAPIKRESVAEATLLDEMAVALVAADAVWEYTDTVTNNMAKAKVDAALAKYNAMKGGSK